MYEELSKFLSQYILKHKQKFFDSRNTKVVVCDGDRLGAAFNVRAFHRTQVMALVRLMLIPLTAQEEALLGPEPPSQARAQQALYRIVSNAPPGSALSASNSNASATYSLALTEEHRRALTLPVIRLTRVDVPTTATAEEPAGQEEQNTSTHNSDDNSSDDSDEDSDRMSIETSEDESEHLRATYAGEMEPVDTDEETYAGEMEPIDSDESEEEAPMQNEE